jgi:hypothetical protein
MSIVLFLTGSSAYLYYNCSIFDELTLSRRDAVTVTVHITVSSGTSAAATRAGKIEVNFQLHGQYILFRSPTKCLAPLEKMPEALEERLEVESVLEQDMLMLDKPQGKSMARRYSCRNIPKRTESHSLKVCRL